MEWLRSQRLVPRQLSLVGTSPMDSRPLDPLIAPDTMIDDGSETALSAN